MRQLVSEAETRLDGSVERIVVVAIVRVGKHLDALEGVKYSWYGQRRRRIRVEPVHAVITLGPGQREFVTKPQVQSQLGSDLVIVLAEKREAETLRAHPIVESLLTRRAAAAAVFGIAHARKKARDRISAGRFVGNTGDLRGGPAVECEVAGRPTGLDEVDPVQPGLGAEFQVVPPSQPTDRTAPVMGVLTLAQNCEGLRTNGSVVAVAEFDEWNRLEAGIEISRKAGAGVKIAEVGEFPAHAVGKVKTAHPAVGKSHNHRWAEGARVIDRQHVARRIVRSARTRIGKILVAVEAGAVSVFLRVLHAQQVAFIKSVINLDVPFVVRVSRCAGRRKVVVLKSIKVFRLSGRVRKKQQHVRSDGIYQIAGYARGRLELRAIEAGVAGTYVCRKIVERNEIFANGAWVRWRVGRIGSIRQRRISVEYSGIRIPNLTRRFRTSSEGVERAPFEGAYLAEIAQGILPSRAGTAAPHALGWHAKRTRSKVVLTQAFVVKEKECLVFFDRAAKGPAKVVALERRNRIAELVREPLVGVHHRVPEEFIQAAVILVASRTADHIDDRTARKTELRGEIGLLNFKFFYRVYRRHIGNILNAAVLFKVGGTGSSNKTSGGEFRPPFE